MVHRLSLGQLAFLLVLTGPVYIERRRLRPHAPAVQIAVHLDGIAAGVRLHRVGALRSSRDLQKSDCERVRVDLHIGGSE